MRVLLDENLPRRLKREFPAEFEVWTVKEKGWSGTKNGALLRLATGEFEAFVTLDHGLPYQQNLEQLDLRVVLLKARSNEHRTLAPLVPQACIELKRLQPGQWSRVPAPAG